MNIFLYVLTNNILPIIFIIVIGFTLGRVFKLDVVTMSKLNFYVFVPSFTFYQIYTTELDSSLALVAVFALLLLAVNFSVAEIYGRLRKHEPGMRNALKNSLMFYNCGNIGVPLITLVFSGAPYVLGGQTPFLEAALAVQIIVLVVQNLTVNTIGFFNASKSSMNWKKALLSIFKMPTIYTVPLAFILKFFVPYDMTQFPLWPAIKYCKEGLIAVALLTLGAQLSRTKFKLGNFDVYAAALFRLIGGPLIALGLIVLLRFDGLTAQTLMISSAVPTALNTALIAVERKNFPDFASQTVLAATVLSPITLTFVVYFSRMLFPVV